MNDDIGEATERGDRPKEAITRSRSRIAIGSVLLIAAVVVPSLVGWAGFAGLAFRLVTGILRAGLIVGSGTISLFQRDGIRSQRGHEADGWHSDPSSFDDYTGDDGGGDGPF